MKMTSPVVRWFQDIGQNGSEGEDKEQLWAAMIREAGGKGANLAEMLRAGIPVPPGFVVVSDAYFAFLEEADLEGFIRESLSSLDVSDSAQLERGATRVKDAIEAAPVPPFIANAIKEAYREMGGGFVAVRSSATAEDLPDASFAGQQSTFLNMIGEESVVEAVRACWASLFEARAIFYRAEHNFDHLSVGIAVPIQRMVQSEISGVMFTVEPVLNDDSTVFIEAIYGLGEGIVSGEINPDTYVVDKASMTITQKTVAPQTWLLSRNPQEAVSREQANVRVDVPPEKRDRQKLDDAQVLELARTGKRLEGHYGHPQDIEWTLEGGRLYVVQTRPVTTLSMTNGAATQAIDAPVLLTGSGASPGVGSGPARVISGPGEIDQVKEGDVLVAEMTTPDFVSAMKRASAIVTDKGGRTAHAAIVSREIGIPCVVGAENATKVLGSGQGITVDGMSGKVYEGIFHVKPAEEVEARYTKTRTRLYVNLADPDLAEEVASQNVDGVGLLRAEFIVADIGEHPRHMLDQGRGHEFTEKLAAGITKFAGAFHPRPVVYRTTDFKTNEYRNLTGGEKYEGEEENPMIGFRGCSRYLEDPEVFRLEANAIKMVRQRYDNLCVMIPFIRTPEELAQVKKLLEAEGINNGKLWMMVELPSNIILLDKFLDVGIDGISIGSNDLTQLILGVDRDNSRYADLFDERNDAVMWALERAISIANERGVTTSICGQAPSFYPELTARLVSWGINSVSVSPDMIDRTRDIIGKVEERLQVLPPQD